jgi:hypothetical protein
MTRGNSIWLSAALVAGSATLASAADIITKAPVAPAAAPIEYGNLYFGVDWTSHKSLAGYMGVLYAPMGMGQSGLRLSAFGLLGQYEYHGGDAGELFNGRFVSSDVLVGWSNVFANGAFTLAVGPNFQHHRVRPNDPNNAVQGSEWGFKVQADLWVNPTPRTLIYALGSYSTAFDTYYSIGRLGYDVTGQQLFFGPEVGGLGNDRTDQVRVGAHLTGIKIGAAKVTVSGGWMHERGEGDGGYVAANMDFSF